MSELRRIPAHDHLWLMASLAEALAGGPAVQPIASDETPSPEHVAEGCALVIHTSGSSGSPKFVAHSAESIRASAEATNAILGGPGQWIIALPTHLIAGVQMLTRSILAGTDPLVVSGKFSPEKLVRLALQLEADRRYVSLVPVQLRAVIELAERDEEALRVLQRFDAMLVGGQAVSLEMRAAAHRLGLKLVRTYGMTETGGGVVYDGVEIGETEMRIRGGEIQLSGPSLALGYLDNDGLTAETFIEEDGVRWYRTGDAGSLLGGMLQVTGRLDRVLISGGVNVSLDRVEALVHEMPGWAESAALEERNDTWGAQVTIVAAPSHNADGGTADGDALRDGFEALAGAVKVDLGPAATPRRLVVVDDLPRLANGKNDYQCLAAMLQEPQRDGATGSDVPRAESKETK